MKLEDEAIEAAVVAMLDRLLEAERIAAASVPPGPHRLVALDRVLPALHRRIRRAARAVYLLLKEDFTYEAAIVARSLFEDSLKVGTLRRAGTERTRLIVGWMNESTNHAERMLREGARSGGHDAAEVADALRIRRRNLATWVKELPINGKLRTFGDERGMAQNLDRLGEYHSYLYASQLTHGAESAFFFDPDPVGDTTADVTTPNVHIAAVALSLSVVSVLRAHIDIAAMLGWPGADEANALLAVGSRQSASTSCMTASMDSRGTAIGFADSAPGGRSGRSGASQ